MGSGEAAIDLDGAAGGDDVVDLKTHAWEDGYVPPRRKSVYISMDLRRVRAM